LNVYNWLSDMKLPEGHKPFDIVEVRFKGSRKEFFKNVNNLELKVGEMVAVEGNPGHDIGEVSMTGELVRFQLKKKSVEEGSTDIKLLYRVAKQADIEKWQEVKNLEHDTMHRARTTALELGLKMKISDVEYQGDGKKTTFFYTADERVDFRELIKRLADQFKVRIEMRQIGMRQEASRLGGIGSCGRELCCSTWLTDFKIVSTSAARYQNLSLNPIKLAGQCGKLKCCLNYELDAYMDALKDIPDTGIKLLAAKGTMLHRKTDIFKRIMWYTLIPDVKEGDDRGFVPENWVPMSVDRVKEIIELNKKNIKPEDAGALDLEEDLEELGYDDVVGQDSLTRLDRQKKKKKKKPSKNREGDAPKEITDDKSAAATPRNVTENRPQQNTKQAPPARPDQQKDKQINKGPNKPQQNRPQQNKPNTNPAPANKPVATPSQNQGAIPNQSGNQPKPNQQPNRTPPPRQRPNEIKENETKQEGNTQTPPAPLPVAPPLNNTGSNRPPRQAPRQNPDQNS
jgi:cell fate regulator YaaT (PSP1 superfamily)